MFTFGGEDFEHGPGDGEFVAKFERRKGEKRAGHVKRRGKDARFHCAAAALRVEKNSRSKNLILSAEPTRR